MKEIGTECGCLCSSAVRPPRNPRRAYDEHGREIEPMTLGNMREHGVRSVDAPCEDCRHRRRSMSMRYPITCTCPTWRSSSGAPRAGRADHHAAGLAREGSGTGVNKVTAICRTWLTAVAEPERCGIRAAFPLEPEGKAAD
jgi:hypothetical protein